jgi:hypothetical protein
MINYYRFYVQPSGSNLNAGSTTGDSAIFIASGDTDGISVFTPIDGTTPSNFVNVNDWCSVYLTSGATTGTFVGRVTSVSGGINGSIVFAANSGTGIITRDKCGIFPSGTNGTISLRCGGAWQGPTGNIGFPFNFVSSSLRNSSHLSSKTKILFKNGTYNISTGIVHNTPGPIFFEGYVESEGDLNESSVIKPIIMGPTTGTSFSLLKTLSVATQTSITNLQFENNGSIGSFALVVCDSLNSVFRWCVAKGGVRGGFETNSQVIFYECAAFNNAGLNALSTNSAGFYLGGAGAAVIRCVSIQNQSNAIGVTTDTPTFVMDNILQGGGRGVVSLASTAFVCRNNSIYNTKSHGIDLVNGSSSGICLIIENNTLGKISGYGITASSQLLKGGFLFNNVFGSGVYGCSLGTTNLDSEINNSIILPLNISPWINETNGNFSPSSIIRNLGRGKYQNVNTGSFSSTLTQSYPDAGAIQSFGSNGQVSYTFFD